MTWYQADAILERAEKFMRLRRGYEPIDGPVDRTWELAAICKKFSDRLYLRGHKIIEYEYGK